MLFNKVRAKALLREAGADAIVATAPLSVDYLTDHRSSFETTFRRYHMVPGGGPELLFRSFALATAAGKRTLSRPPPPSRRRRPRGRGRSRSTVPPASSRRKPRGWTRSSATWRAARAPERRREPAAGAGRPIAGAVPQAGRVAVEAAGLAAGELEALRELVPGIEIGDGSVLLRLIRMVKTADEIARSRRAAEIAEGALGALVAAAAPGRTLAELAQVFRRELAAGGADLEHVAIDPSGSASPRSPVIGYASATCCCSTSAASIARASPTRA